MGNNPDINFQDEIIMKIANEIGSVMGNVNSSREKASLILAELEGLDAYNGKAIEENIIFYSKLAGHIDTLTLLYGMAIQQGFNSFSRLYEADRAGTGGV